MHVCIYRKPYQEYGTPRPTYTIEGIIVACALFFLMTKLFGCSTIMPLLVGLSSEAKMAGGVSVSAVMLFLHLARAILKRMVMSTVLVWPHLLLISVEPIAHEFVDLCHFDNWVKSMLFFQTTGF